MLMKNSNWKNLILSVGKFHIRVLSPIEVAEHINLAQQDGFSLKEIALRCDVTPAMLSKFKNLLKIREDYWHLIDWGEPGSSIIAFSIAQSIARFDEGVQKQILDAKIKYKFNKDNINTLNQRIDLSGKTVKECIEEEAAKKQKTVISLLIGSLFAPTVEKLNTILQFDKDKLIQSFFDNEYHEYKVIAKLGKKEFSVIIQDSNLFAKLHSQSSLLENRVNNFLQSQVNDPN